MIKLLVISFSSNTTNPGLHHLQNSLKKFGYMHALLPATNECWGGDNCTVIEEWLKQNRATYTHLLYTDAWDTLALAPVEELISKYEPHKNYWIYSAEKNCYPRYDWKDEFKESGAWKYLNAGQFIAPIDLFIETVHANPRAPGKDDQEWGSSIYLFNNHSNKIKLDVGCEIFQSLYMEHEEDFAWTRNGRLFNRVTETYPVFAHANGKVDMRWIYHPRESPFYT
jgi:hypothetical protein